MARFGRNALAIDTDQFKNCVLQASSVVPENPVVWKKERNAIGPITRDFQNLFRIPIVLYLFGAILVSVKNCGNIGSAIEFDFGRKNI